ncbi:hypothetical protein PR003_g26307 [Phytophthora rubi]|uniref:Uncharacterized protein n=1 Tax=Phytophthora rubi TaxID=129364 RepID=A0A6A3I0U9_9STRA|nr:hypothetical protein PR001_g26126 [Phytophthora rubi]KAE9286495.1 hypothetical protein PR003_g26307 [Phytophthora rubi]
MLPILPLSSLVIVCPTRCSAIPSPISADTPSLVSSLVGALLYAFFAVFFHLLHY